MSKLPTPSEIKLRARTAQDTRINGFKTEIKEHIKKNIPKKYQISFSKALSGQISPRGAIKAKCQSCVGHEDTRERIKNCSCYLCPLIAVRPYQD